MPAPSGRSVSQLASTLPPAVLAAIAALVAAVDSAPVPVVAASLGATAAVIGHRIREAFGLTIIGIVMGVVLSVVAAWSADLADDSLTSVTAGAALLVGVSELAPTATDRRLGPFRVGIAGIATALAIASSSTIFLVAGALLFAIDVAALLVRGDRGRLMICVGVAGAALAVGIVARTAVDAPPLPARDTGQSSIVAVWMLGIGVVIAGTRAATEGVRDRLAGSAAPVVAAIVGLIEHDRGAPIVILLTVVLVALVARTAPIWLPHDRVVPRPPPPPLAEAGITVAIRSKRDQQ